MDLRPILLATVVLLAGCTDDNDADASGDDATAGDAPLEAYETTIEMSDCYTVELISPAPGADLASHVPAGFEVSAPPAVVLGAMVCQGGEVERGFWAIGVTPTDEALVSPRATNHFWIVEHYVGNETAFAAALDGVRAVTTDAQVTGPGNTNGFAIRAENTTYEWGSTGGTVTGTWPVIATVLPSFREYFAADGGYAYIDASFGGEGGAGAGVGALLTEGDAPGAAHYGPGSNQVGLVNDASAYADAMVGFIPYP
ncbi:MAG: hypothetical protein ACPGQL_04715 [Thermoplasmatota archaeon]